MCPESKVNENLNPPLVADVAIVGAGIIGLSLALELRQRGLSVIVMERGQAMSSASWAAGGMLAVHDPEKPPGLLPIALRSWALYPDYLDNIGTLSGQCVPLRTHRTLQQLEHDRVSENIATEVEIAEVAPGLDAGTHRFEWLEESSLDPNDLREALPTAFRAVGGKLLEGTEVLRVESGAHGVSVEMRQDRVSAGIFVNCCGAWAGRSRMGSLPGIPVIPVIPVKGQMTNLRCLPERLHCVVRTSGLYLIPRGDGRVTIGSTLEDAGFDETVQETCVRKLIDSAQHWLPEATIPKPKESWAGLRPGTPDGLPILGRAEREHCWHATGHFRDGILLAPATARLMTQAILGETPEISLSAFSPGRF